MPQERKNVLEDVVEVSPQCRSSVGARYDEGERLIRTAELIRSEDGQPAAASSSTSILR